MGILTDHVVRKSITNHHTCCEFWVDQYPQECTCGESAPRAPWFDKTEKDHAEHLAKRSQKEAEEHQ